MPLSKENLQSVITIAQNLLSRISDKSQITAAMIADNVSTAGMLFAPDGLDEADERAAIDELVRRFSSWIGQDSTLENSEGHVAWLDSARKKDWRYWQRYREWSERKMSADAVDALDASTDRVLGNLEDPRREGAWDRRGLVVGHVQSGKTGNYTGLVCKAADAGYKIIIVLAGMHNNLRSQTQIRLEEGFLGNETAAIREMGKIIGVGGIDADSKIRPNCATLRSDAGDFNSKVAKHLAISPEERPWLFVVKKNKTVLERLLKWIVGRVADATDSSGRKYVSNLPLLLIDDEADHASVDTGEQLFDADGAPDDEHQPKAINSRIRKILHSFAKSAYVGYTATPFANIFIHRRAETLEEGPDIFPSAFITNLAAPSNYIGPARLFGLRTTEGRTGGLPLTGLIDDHASDDGTTGWMPLKHNKAHIPLYQGSDSVPASLVKAVHAFVLTCAARACRGQRNEHSSMLVHVTRFTDVQKEVHRQVDELVTRMKQRISRQVDHQELLGEMQLLWETDFKPKSEEIKERAPDLFGAFDVLTWQQVVEEIPNALADIQVRMVNGKAKDVVDYIENEGLGLKVIAIGGDKLARGLTLEGLCTSYFVRTTRMYDTLMQMGRWFGYRPGYVDLCRLYTTSDLIEWFGHIADASEELREEFDVMAASGATPREYGLKVQSHPVLMVTSPLKMRTAKSLQLSFSGQLLETVSLYKEHDRLESNLAATETLLSQMGSPCPERPSQIRNGKAQIWDDSHVWTKVPGDLIADFFAGYVTHPKARKVNSMMLSDFVRAMNAVGELDAWTVVLIGGGSGNDHTFQNGLRVENMLKRSMDKQISDRYSIGRLLSPRDEAIDLNEVAWSAALAATIEAWKPDPTRETDGSLPKAPESPSGPQIRHVRGFGVPGQLAPARNRGLLLIYPLDPEKAVEEAAEQAHLFNGWKKPVIAFGVSFPSSDSGQKVEYKVDHLIWEQEYGAAD
ncbi:Z1 domain-containing protein [Caballeronia sp. LZ029]|uniref:Z1 domain-containing protein n=1 Tax=Caballeronia sp. LZ029 TaxID=3038564 RepID=UPI00285AAB78|nr:Z1 domain-containing protein [Caballeronia sp. LZ029]MDR5744446.1 Z1 domain-containing protein [Caballeronia sp. LZ029]